MDIPASREHALAGGPLVTCTQPPGQQSAGGVPPATTPSPWRRVLRGRFLCPVGPRRIPANAGHLPACDGAGDTPGGPAQGVVPPLPESTCSPRRRAGFSQYLNATKQRLKNKTKLPSLRESNEGCSPFLIKSSCVMLGRDKCSVGRSTLFWIESPEQKVLINSRHMGPVRRGGDGSLL